MRRAALAVLACALALPAGAAASAEDVLLDCGDDGRLSKRYTQAEYRDALRHLPADADGYTDCRDIIRDAKLAAAAGRRGAANDGGGGAAGAPQPPDPTAGAGGALTDPLGAASDAERAAVAAATAAPARPSRVGGKLVAPGDVGLAALGGPSGLPAPLIAALALLGAGALVATGLWGRRRLTALRSASVA